MEWVLGVVVVLAAAVTMAIVGALRNARLRKRVRVDITNAGNVKSCYDLRAHDPAGNLRFQFEFEGDSLPVHSTPSPAGAGEPAPEKPGKAPAAASAGALVSRAGRVIQLGGAVAGVLSMVGSLLPRSVGGPLQQWASQIRGAQSRASYVQQAPGRIAMQTTSVARSVTKVGGAAPRPGRTVHPEEGRSREPSASPAEQGDGHAWAQTPYVEPGHSLPIDLLVRCGLPARRQAHTFQVISRAANVDTAPPVHVVGSVDIDGGFWVRRFLPYALVWVLTVVLMFALLALGFWLVSSGVFA